MRCTSPPPPEPDKEQAGAHEGEAETPQAAVEVGVEFTAHAVHHGMLTRQENAAHVARQPLELRV